MLLSMAGAGAGVEAVLPASGDVLPAASGGAAGTGGKVSAPLLPQAINVVVASRASAKCCRIGQFKKLEMLAQDE
jgi:hypothetical protein